MNFVKKIEGIDSISLWNSLNHDNRFFDKFTNDKRKIFHAMEDRRCKIRHKLSCIFSCYVTSIEFKVVAAAPIRLTFTFILFAK